MAEYLCWIAGEPDRDCMITAGSEVAAEIFARLTLSASPDETVVVADAAEGDVERWRAGERAEAIVGESDG